MEVKKLDKNFFPENLLEIPQPPKDLWILGEIPKKDLIYLCVVGSRKFSSYGKEACEKIIEGLKGYPICIVSGFALGIDTLAHKTAIKNGLKTIAFPGSGLNKEAIYPKLNISLVDEILKNGGCLISEFEPNFKATPWSFPMRNRIMAGFSKAILVIEAEEKSGTLITARLATEYNKDVLAIPGSIYSRNSKGTNRLIRQGATPITSSKEVLEALGFEIEETEEDKMKQKNLILDLSEEEKKVYEILSLENTEREDLIYKLQMQPQKVNALLSLMEIKGIIREELGKFRLS